MPAVTGVVFMKKFLALAVIAFLFSMGCTSTRPGDMTAPHLCKNLCAVGETQAPYPGCACSGGEDGGLGHIRVCPNLCPPGQTQSAYPGCACSGGTGGSVGGAGGQGGVTQSYNWSLLYGGEAAARTSQGSLLVIFSAKNGGSGAYKSLNASVGRVSAYLEGAGPGWYFVSTGNHTVDIAALGNKSVAVAFNRVWVGKYTRLVVELFGLNATSRATLRDSNISLPAAGYAFVIMAPVNPSASSAVELVFDLENSFAQGGGGAVFMPSVEVRSFHDIQYIQMDDGSTQLYAGTLDLSEAVRFYAPASSSYTVLGGNSSSCVYNCTLLCATPSAEECHYKCVGECIGEPVSPTYNRCNDGTPFGMCSDRKPYLCLSTADYLADCVACGCPGGQSCDRDSGTCSMVNETCHDGSFIGQCMPDNRPYRCNGGYSRIADCWSCGCPEGEICRENGECEDYGN